MIRRETKDLTKKEDDPKRDLETCKGSKSEEAFFKQIHKEIKSQFRKDKEESELIYLLRRQQKDEEIKQKQKEDKDKQRQEALAKQQDKIRWKGLRSQEESSLKSEEKQFLERMNTKFPSPYVILNQKNLGFLLYYYFNVEKIEPKDDNPTSEPTEEEEARFEANEKEALFENTVKEFRTRFEKRADHLLLQECYRVLGQEYLKKHDIREALKYFQAFKMLCEKNRAYIMKMLAYKEIGFCYKLVKQYKSALINFKKLLQLSWYRKHRGWEMKAYDFIGIAYYYLGEIEKSKYYHKRMWEGIYEGENSAVRTLAINSLKQKLETKLTTDERGIPQIKDDTSYVINQSDEDENDLPSPRTGSGEENLKLLPYFNLKKAQSSRNLPSISSNRKPPLANRKMAVKTALTSRVKPFMLISHLSPNESPNNYFYVEQMNSFRVRGEQFKAHN
jgi:tetratricopeptide (TPR) repeat protein